MLFAGGASTWDGQRRKLQQRSEQVGYHHELTLLYADITTLSVSWRFNDVDGGSLVFVISKLLKRHSKAKRRAPACSRILIIQLIDASEMRPPPLAPSSLFDNYNSDRV